MTTRRPNTWLAGCCAAALLAACAGSAPAPLAPAQAPVTAVLTATPYARPPEPTMVDPAGVVSAGAASLREVSYRVEAGDTLIGMANRYDTTIEAIMRRNNLTNATDLKIGQNLVVPTNVVIIGTSTPVPSATGTPRAGATPTPAVTAIPGGSQLYTVERGDTAADIAIQFGITMEALAQTNKRTVASLSTLQPGDRLTIPQPR